MSALVRALRRVFGSPATAQYGDKELTALKTRAQATLDNMLQLKREREEQRRETEQAVIGTLKTVLLSLEAAEFDAKNRRLTDAQENILKTALGEMDKMLDKKERETAASLSKEMEKHVARVVQIKNAPIEQKEAMLKELTDEIMSDTHPPPPAKQS